MYIKTWERCSLRLPGDNIYNIHKGNHTHMHINFIIILDWVEWIDLENIA